MKKIAIVALLSAFAATPALADNTGKFYAAGDFGSITLSNTNPGGQEFPNPNALRISGGYHFNPMLAVEIGYALIGDSTLNYSGFSVTEKNSAVQVTAVGTYPVKDGFELFGKFGLSSNSNKVTGTGTRAGLNTSNSKIVLMYGIGAQFNFTQQFGIRAQYEDFGKTTVSNNLNGLSWDAGIKQISLGIVYNF